MDNKIKLIVVDDLKFSRTLFINSVRLMPHLHLEKAFETCDEALEYLEGHDVNLVIMDIMMRTGVDGLVAARRIKEQKPYIKVILVTGTAESKWMNEAKEIGAESFWYKEYSEEKLEDIIQRTLAGESVYPDKVPDLPFGDTMKSALTERELDVLRELTGGYSNQEIADRLEISVNTVRTHITNMINKTGYESRFDLALNAKALGAVVGSTKKGE